MVIVNQESLRVYLEPELFYEPFTKYTREKIGNDPKMLHLYKINVCSWWSGVQGIVVYKN